MTLEKVKDILENKYALGLLFNFTNLVISCIGQNGT